MKAAKKAHDWAMLRELMESIDTQQSVDELVPAWQRREIPEPRWAQEYVPALQQALEQHDESDLVALLASGRLIHPVLLPVLAEVVHGLRQHRKGGRSIGLLEVQETFLRDLYMQFTGPGQMTADKFVEDWVERLGVSRSTIERAVGIRKKSA